MNHKIKELLVILGFEKDIKKEPMMKEVRKNFLKLSMKKHPDKPGGSNEAFQELIDAYEQIGKHIQNMAQDDLNDLEETFARKLFKETNFEKINLYSITVSILTIHADAWIKVLKEKYGEPNDKSESSNGVKFTDNASPLCVTLWKKAKYQRSTLLIDARGKQSICLEYVEKELPIFFEKVLEISSLENTKNSVQKGRKRSLSSGDILKMRKKQEISCKECDIIFMSILDRNMHTQSCHEIIPILCTNCDFVGVNAEDFENKFLHP